MTPEESELRGAGWEKGLAEYTRGAGLRHRFRRVARGSTEERQTVSTDRRPVGSLHAEMSWSEED